MNALGMFAGLMWTAAGMAVVLASFIALAGCSDLDLRWGIPAAIGCLAGTGAGFVSMVYSLALLTHSAGT